MPLAARPEMTAGAAGWGAVDCVGASARVTAPVGAPSDSAGIAHWAVSDRGSPSARWPTATSPCDCTGGATTLLNTTRAPAATVHVRVDGRRRGLACRPLA